MKAKIVLLFIMVISINSYQFLRKLEVTKDSCEKAGKDFQEAKPAQCKAGSTIFEVSKEDDCKKGKWTSIEGGICSGTADPALNEEKCKGTPKYTEAVITTKCKVGTTDVPSGNANEDACKNAVKWTEANCNVEGISTDDCEASKVTWNEEEGTCQITTSSSTVSFTVSTKSKCTGISVSWGGSENDAEKKCIVTGYDACGTAPFSLDSETCSIDKTTITSSDDCKKPSWTKTKDASCKVGDKLMESKKDKDSCDSLKSAISLIQGSCSISGVSEQDCKEGGKFTSEVTTKAKCTLDTTEITNPEKLESKSACETALVWQTGTCSNAQVTNKDDCEAEYTYTEGTEAKCVNKEGDNSSKSNSSFLVYEFALVFAIGLLF